MVEEEAALTALPTPAEPVEPAALGRFLPAWQGVAAVGASMAPLGPISPAMAVAAPPAERSPEQRRDALRAAMRARAERLRREAAAVPRGRLYRNALLPLDPLAAGDGIMLPVPVTTDPTNPLNVTRMHLTVYAPPIPEPSGLAGLGMGVVGAVAAMGAAWIRRA